MIRQSTWWFQEFIERHLDDATRTKMKRACAADVPAGGQPELRVPTASVTEVRRELHQGINFPGTTSGDDFTESAEDFSKTAKNFLGKIPQMAGSRSRTAPTQRRSGWSMVGWSRPHDWREEDWADPLHFAWVRHFLKSLAAMWSRRSCTDVGASSSRRGPRPVNGRPGP
jgi:hypothetical protein